ncbi:MAG: hypothetical protein NXI12_13715 [Alphaproteobacteria bacterium]|nr:hypothetical protein [Alphaproteobacteria bacterium]
MKPAARRYTFAFTGFMMCYSGLVLGVPFLDRAFELSSPVRLLLALAPVVPALFALREFVIFLRAADEVQARIQSEAILITAGVVAFASFAWGFVEGWMEVPDLSFIWILPAMVAVWGCALPFVTRRYR